jgi:hypothetical protein
VGTGDDGLPGLFRVDTGDRLAEGLSLAVLGGYGYTGSTVEADENHHRSIGRLIASYGFSPELAVALRLDGRYDRHTRLSDGTDDGWVGDPRLLIRYARELSPAAAVALQAGLWLPGSDAPSVVFKAITPEVSGSFTYRLGATPLALSTTVGYRYDRSAASVDNPELLSPSDRMSLGASDFNALLAGAGLRYAHSGIELFGEVTGNILVGNNAPTSPLLATAGGRYFFGDSIQGMLTADVRLNSIDAPADPMELRPFEPTLRVLAGVQINFARPPAPAPLPQPDPEPEPEPPKTSPVSIRVVHDGQALAGARVILIRDGKPVEETTTDENGVATFEDQLEGNVRLRVVHDGFNPLNKDVEIQRNSNNETEVTLEKSLPPGQLRGVIRDFAGKGLNAKLTVEKVGDPFAEIFESNADGSFEIDLLPGQYKVTIESNGFSGQEREIVIEQDGVTIMNVGLRRAP